MTFTSLVLKNAGRNRLQTALTASAVAFSLLCLLLLRTVMSSWTSAVDDGLTDRLASWNKVSYQLPLPLSYVDQVRRLPGIDSTSFATWAGAKDPRHPSEFFLPFAVDTDSYFRVYDDMKVAPDRLDAWKRDRQGAILGDALMTKLGYKVGDLVTLEGSTFAGDLQFRIDGVYTTNTRSVDRSQFIFHWRYLNDNLPEAQRNQVGWMMSRVNPKDTGRLARAIDAMFEERGAQTLSMSEQAMKIVFLSNFSALLNGVNAICVVLLAVILLILGNGLAMRLRERSHEYGVLAAIGFRRPRIMRLVLGEAAAIGGIGGCLGILLAYLIINRGIGPYLEQNMGSFFPYFRVPWPAACTGFVICLAGATAAAVFPALRAARLNVVDALRKVN